MKRPEEQLIFGAFSFFCDVGFLDGYGKITSVRPVR